MSKRKPKIPKRVQRLLDRMKAGETLCKALRLKETGETEVQFFLDPSNRACGEWTASAAIERGLVVPNGDGLFGPDTSQAWRLAQ